MVFVVMVCVLMFCVWRCVCELVFVRWCVCGVLCCLGGVYCGVCVCVCVCGDFVEVCV